MRNEVILHKLIGYVDKITQYCTGRNYSSFSADSQLVEACVFNLSQMGELVGKLDDSFLEAHSDIPWRAMRGLRNRIVHDYDGVTLRLVWDVIEGDLPELKTMLTSI
ncbi:MAG: HepT-like ribonuclease domain-containing protein [Oscillospiraceae bacterium]